jgi:hypothetical protein
MTQVCLASVYPEALGNIPKLYANVPTVWKLELGAMCQVSLDVSASEVQDFLRIEKKVVIRINCMVSEHSHFNWKMNHRNHKAELQEEHFMMPTQLCRCHQI